MFRLLHHLSYIYIYMCVCVCVSLILFLFSFLYNCSEISVGPGSDRSFPPASEKSTGGPPASRLSSPPSEFWPQMTHFALFFQGKKASPLSKLVSAALRSSKLTPPTALSRQFPLFGSNPTDCTKHHRAFAQQWSAHMTVWNVSFLWYETLNIVWQLEDGITRVRLCCLFFLLLEDTWLLRRLKECDVTAV